MRFWTYGTISARGQDYYEEGSLIWLRADTIIREHRMDRNRLTTSCVSFSASPIPKPYTREDVEAALSAICPYKLARAF